MEPKYREQIKLNLTRYWIHQGPNLMAGLFILAWLGAIVTPFIYNGAI